MKRLVAVVGERLAQLKLNGTILCPSPLSRVIELEALVAGVGAKRRGWVALRAYAGGDHLAGIGLAELEARAGRQIDELERLHTRVADLAFGPAANSNSAASDRGEPGSARA